MPRYFFDLDNGRSFFVDGSGVSLMDADAAKAEAVRTLAEAARGGTFPADWRSMTVTARDDSGEVVVRAKLTLSAERRKPAEWRV